MALINSFEMALGLIGLLKKKLSKLLLISFGSVIVSPLFVLISFGDFASFAFKGILLCFCYSQKKTRLGVSGEFCSVR